MSNTPPHTTVQDSEYYIGSFNPSDSPAVTEIKDASKALIEVIQRNCVFGRRSAAACTGIEQAQMIAVKSLFAGA